MTAVSHQKFQRRNKKRDGFYQRSRFFTFNERKQAAVNTGFNQTLEKVYNSV